MKILNDLSVKDLKLNRKRSLVIIIGIILSTALICGVAGLVTSFQNTFIEHEKEVSGNFHVQFCDVPKNELKYIEENRNIKDYYLSEDLGYSYLEKSQNEYKPYVFVVSASEKYLNNMGLHLIDGRLPENDEELLISEHIRTNGEVDYKVGDTVILNIGKRQLTTGEELKQNNPYLSGNYDNGEVLQEEIVDTYEKKYKIVGIIERPSSAVEGYSAPGYTVFSKMEKVKEKADIAVLYKNVFKYQEYTEQINQMVKAETKEEKKYATEFNGFREVLYKSYKYIIKTNYYLLAYEGANLGETTMTALYTVGGIIMIIILVSSVFVIRNGFAISITERLKQYGMLSSIGATKKQIKKSVYFEGFVLGSIGIIFGILSGIFAIDILLKIVNFILNNIDNIDLKYKISWFAIGVSVLVSSITIWLSCRSSAKKASKITPIEAIRNSQDIKLKAKKIKCPKIIKTIFKTGGEIAYKNLKRSKKKYRTTVISIIVSIVTFIAISSFIDYGFKMSSSYYTEIKYNIDVYDFESHIATKENMKDKYERFLEISKLDGVDKYSINRMNILKLNTEDKLTDVGKLVKSNTYTNEIDENGNERRMKDEFCIVSLGEQEYKRFIKEIGGNYEKYKDGAILIDEVINYNDNKKIQGNLYTYNKDDVITGKVSEAYDREDATYDEPLKEKEINIKIVARTSERPMGLENLYNSKAYLIVSDEYMDWIGYTSASIKIQATDAYKVEERINEYYKNKNMNDSDMLITNYDEAVKAENAVVLIISIFLYGFITVITLIGITNIFNTITTNMNLRKKEFAMLKSIGMTKKEFNRMIRLESIFYGLKSLIIGIPIGCALSYAIFKAFENEMNMYYVLPFKAIFVAVVFVAIVISLIMKYSMTKINKQNIIETIRNDNI